MAVIKSKKKQVIAGITVAKDTIMNIQNDMVEDLKDIEVICKSGYMNHPKNKMAVDAAKIKKSEADPKVQEILESHKKAKKEQNSKIKTTQIK